MAAIRAYEMELFGRLLDGLASIPGARVWGITDRERFDERTPTAALTFDGITPEAVAVALGARGIATWWGNFYAVGVTERLGLAESARAYTVTYSLGMKKRLALALALIHEPQVLILDEPTNGLDPAGAKQMRETITELAARGRTIFISTHLLDAAERLCHRVAIIQRGKLQAVGTPDELRAHYQTPGSTLEDLFLRVTTDG